MTEHQAFTSDHIQASPAAAHGDTSPFQGTINDTWGPGKSAANAPGAVEGAVASKPPAADAKTDHKTALIEQSGGDGQSADSGKGKTSGPAQDSGDKPGTRHDKESGPGQLLPRIEGLEDLGRDVSDHGQGKNVVQAGGVGKAAADSAPGKDSKSGGENTPNYEGSRADPPRRTPPEPNIFDIEKWTKLNWETGSQSSSPF